MPPDDPTAPDEVAVPAPAARSGVAHPRLVALVAMLTVVVAVVDQLTKAWALRALAPGERVDLAGRWLGLEVVHNPGAALSFATGMTWVLTAIAVVVVVVVARAARRLGSGGWAVAFGLLLGGAVGNLVDRLFRAPGPGRGEVVDFIAYADWFVGNVADVAIVAAALLVVLQTVRGVHLDGTRDHEHAAPPAGDAAPVEPAEQP